MAQHISTPQGSSLKDSDALKALKKSVLHLERELRSSIRTARTTEEVAENSKRLLLSTQDKLVEEVRQHQKTEADLRTASQASEAASEAKSRFLATMSHEMRTPLNGVVGMLDLLLETPLNDHQRELSRLAQDSAHVLVVLINRVLDFSTMEAGHLQLQYEVIDLRRTLEDLIYVEAVTAHTKGLKLCAVIDPALPRQVICDGDRLRQVLLNLIRNAVKFTENGEVDLRVRYEREGEATSLAFEVIDTGVGMSPEDCSRLFEPFTQADSSTTRAVTGTGLGLSISRHLVALLGGSLSVESLLGSGSHFNFVVPVRIQPNTKGRTPKPVLKGQRVGVLDRHGAFVDFVRTVVEPLGGQVLAVGDEAEARQLSASEDLLLLLVDHEFDQLLENPPAGVRLIGLAPRRTDGPNEIHGVPVLRKPVRSSRLAEALILCLSSDPDDALPALDSAGIRTPPKALPQWSARVLVVDDNRANVSVARLMLERLGCDVEGVDSGLATLERIDNESFDLVFMDCSMPGMDGYETTRTLRSREGTARDSVVIAMTAFAMVDDRQRCIDAGMNDYISKPVGLGALREILTRHLGPPARYE